MNAVARFIKPTPIKILFLMEWILFIGINVILGKMDSLQSVLIAIYPLLFFYLIACILSAVSRHRERLAGKWGMVIFVVGLILLDQGMKQLAAVTIKDGMSHPVLDNWLHFANFHNDRGSWVLGFFDMQVEIASVFANIGVGIVFFLGLILFYCFYVTKRRKSLWADVAFLGVFSGYAGFLCDMNTRGYVLDYIHLPHIVAADLKDIALAIGLAAFFSEIIDNPAISLRDAFRWQGWRKEWNSLASFVQEFGAFTVGKLRTFLRSVRWRQRNSIEKNET
jgi:lipoprotein signal peptidase